MAGFLQNKFRRNKILDTIIKNNFVFAVILLLNFSAVFYGLYSYSEQILGNKWYSWIFIPDCPLYILFFIFTLFCLKYGVKNEFLVNLSFFGLVKYSLWTIFVILISISYIIENFYIEYYLINIILHLGMLLEGIILIHKLQKEIKINLLIFVWFLINDTADYFFKLHPYIFQISNFNAVRIFSFTSTFFIFFFLVFYEKKTAG